ncbi:MAG: tRNA (guanosine(18)-2'-O)-methyltransferase TrmH, partial [Porticoccaceae bacterium]|nr:tRNA (guanosine(18)-2'-O)-methyltransferase TrmH [Porticoccaceae bacterium]
MTPERFAKAVQVLNYRQPDLTVVTDQVHKGQNLSAIIRTCDAVGIMALHSVYDAATFKAHT